MSIDDRLLNIHFYRQLFRKTIFPIVSVLLVGILYVILMSLIDHRAFPMDYLILVFALVKTIVLALTTLNQLARLIRICHSVERLLWVFGLLIGLSIFSFATDFTCLYQFDSNAFEGVTTQSRTYIDHLFHFFYFSVITFSTVGYGDIVPVSMIARILSVMEIFLSFFIVVFALANIKKVHIK